MNTSFTQIYRAFNATSTYLLLNEFRIISFPQKFRVIIVVETFIIGRRMNMTGNLENQSTCPCKLANEKLSPCKTPHKVLETQPTHFSEHSHTAIIRFFYNLQSSYLLVWHSTTKLLKLFKVQKISFTVTSLQVLVAAFMKICLYAYIMISMLNVLHSSSHEWTTIKCIITFLSRTLVQPRPVWT